MMNMCRKAPEFWGEHIHSQTSACEPKAEVKHFVDFKIRENYDAYLYFNYSAAFYSNYE